MKNQTKIKSFFLCKWLLSSLLMLLALGENSFAQLSGVKTIPGNYATIALAVADLNTQGVGAGGVTFDIAAGHTELLLGPIVLTATGTSGNTITFQKSGAGANPLITSYVGVSAGLAGAATIDGMFILSGSDYVTIDGISLQESAANITTNTATVQMEVGFGLFKASATNACQNNRIKNCNTTFGRASAVNGASWTGSTAIITANATWAAVSTLLVPTLSSGANSNNTFNLNTLTGGSAGIQSIGYLLDLTNALCDQNNNYTNNTISDYGNTTTNSAHGISFSGAVGFNCSGNTITSSSTNKHAGTINGVFNSNANVGGSGLIDNNIITLNGGGTTTNIQGVRVQAGTSAAIITISNNQVINSTYTTSTSGAFFGILTTGSAGTYLIKSNIISGNSITGAATFSGQVYMVSVTTGSPANVIIHSNNINSNSISNGVLTSATGAVRAMDVAVGANVLIRNNTIDGFNRTNGVATITVGNFAGIYCLGGTTTNYIKANTVKNLNYFGSGIGAPIIALGSGQSADLQVDSNTITSIFSNKTTATGTSGVYGIYNQLAATQERYTYNSISNVISLGATTTAGMNISTAAGTRNVSNNTISAVSSLGAVVNGIVLGNSTPSIFNNKIFNISSTLVGAPVVSGITISSVSATGAAIYNNIIGDISATNATSATATAPSVRGINITATGANTTFSVYFNTVYLTGSSAGSLYSSAALFHTYNLLSTSAVLDSRNNIFVNNSTSQGAGVSAAFMRSAATDLNNYSNNSNNNLLYAGTSPNNLIYFDGTNSDATLTAFKARVASRETASVTENPSFLSTSGASANYLHISTSASQIESGAISILNFDKDIDGHFRNNHPSYPGGAPGFPTGGSAPDIGADEYQGTTADLSPPTISYTGLSIVCGTSYTLTASVSDISGVPQSMPGLPVLWWKIGAGGSYTSTTGTYVSGTNYNFTFGSGATLGQSVFYYIVARDNAPVQNVAVFPSAGASGASAVDPLSVSTPPTSPSSYTVGSSLSGVKTIGISGDYATIGAAIADYNSGCLAGAVIFELIDNSYSEASVVTINNNSYASAINTLTIRPASSITSRIVFTSGNTTANFDLNGARYVTIDGRPGGLGTNQYLSIRNSSGTAPTVRLINEASNNLITYCDLQSNNATGVVLFSTTTGTNGNDNNTLSYCSIHSAIGGTPAIGVNALGTVTFPSNFNDNNTITNCFIYDCYATNGFNSINVQAGNSAWSILNNRIYQSTPRNVTSGFPKDIFVQPGTAGTGFTISGNYIGGSDSLDIPTNPAYTLTGTSYQYDAIGVFVGFSPATSVQGNTITHMSISTTSSSIHAGIHTLQGVVNIGTITGNLIGKANADASVAPAIVFNGTNSSSNTHSSFRAIYAQNNNTPASCITTISNNIIAGIELASTNTAGAVEFSGIENLSGVITVSNNTIGSTTIPKSIYYSSTNLSPNTAQSRILGISLLSANSSNITVSITNNTIANIYSNYANAGSPSTTGLKGIYITGTLNSNTNTTISNNTIFNLTTFALNTGTALAESMGGISFTATATGSSINISNNTIYGLSILNGGVAAVQATGIYIGSSPTGGTNLVTRNFIHSFSVSATNTGAIFNGIEAASGTWTYTNNMIRLGLDVSGLDNTTPMTIRGIFKSSTLANNFYFNSVYIGGSGVGITSSNSFGYIKTNTTTVADDVRNNIFANNRSNAGVTGGKHYSVSLVNASAFTLNYNNYFGTGTGYVFGLIASTDALNYSAGWFSGDNNSLSGDPQFINPNGNSSNVDLHISALIPTVIEQTGTNIASVSTDFDGQTRSTLSPEDIGADAGSFIQIPPCAGTPPSPNVGLNNNASICGTGIKIISLIGFTDQVGYSFQWQESATGLAGSFVNVTTGSGQTTTNYTTGTLSATTPNYFQCLITCANGGASNSSQIIQVVVNPIPVLITSPASGSSVCSGSVVDLTSSGASTYSWAAVPNNGTSDITGYPVATSIITSRALANISVVPTLTISNSATTSSTIATPVWKYTLTGTSSNGCTSTALISLNVISASTPRQLTYSNSPSTICAPGTPVSLTVNNGGAIGAGSWTYSWYNSAGTTLLQSTTNTSSTDTYTQATPATNGNYSYLIKVSNSLCPISYAVATPSFFVGYSSTNSVSNANCGDNGIVTIYPEGQSSQTIWYSNDFSSGLLGAGVFDDSYTGGTSPLTTHTMFPGGPTGQCVLSTLATNKSGNFIVRNPGNINTNNIQIDFTSTTSPLGFGASILGGGGWAWSYASDLKQGGTLTPATGGFNAENGSGSGVKIAVDGTANGAINVSGAYLMYNCSTLDQGPNSSGVIAFVPGTFWQDLLNANASISITENGLLTFKLNDIVVFEHIALPAAYLTANKSSWLHAFTSRTGSASTFNAIDNLSIQYSSYEYSTNSTNGTDGIWQTANSFTGLATGTYPTWVRNPSNTACFSNTGSAVIGTSSSPSSAITVAASGFSTTVCAGNSTSLTTDVSVPGAIFLWESSSSVVGPYVPASGVNNTAIYTSDALLANTYFRCSFTCPSASTITSTPVLVVVNIGSIASTNSPLQANCLGDAVTLSATPGPNTTCVWYAAATGGSPLFTGDNYFVTPSSLPATYYVEPVTTLYTNHYDNGGNKVISNGLGSTTTSPNSVCTRFTTTASIRIDSIKVYPTTTGTLIVSMQNSGSSVNLQSATFSITSTGSFINIPVNFTTPGSGAYQITTSGPQLTYYSSYNAGYGAPYMSLGGVFALTGGSTSLTGASSTLIYGTAFNWSITTSCPSGFGARVPVVVNLNPTNALSLNVPSAKIVCNGAIQQLTVSSPTAYPTFTWSPVTNLFTDAAATVAYTSSANFSTVYFKSTSGTNSTTYVATASGAGCNNQINTTITRNNAPSVTLTATPNVVIAPGNIQLNTTVIPAGTYSYDWSSNPLFLNATNIANPIAQNIASSQIYSLALTDLVTTCVVNKTISVATLTGPPNCPATVSVNNSSCITSTTISWTAVPIDVSGYNVFIGTDGGGISTPTNLISGQDVGSATSVNLPLLQPGITYYYQIKPYNLVGENSSCSIGSFTSGQSIVQVPTQSANSYTETIDNGVVSPALPCGMTSSNENFPADAFTWYTSTSAPNSGTRHMRIDKNTNNTTPKDDWFYSAPMNLTAGKLYRIYFWHRVSTAGSETFELYLSNSADAATMTTTSAIFNGSSNLLSYKLDSSSNILPSVSGVYYYGFHANGAANGRSLYMDDIQVREVPVSALEPASCTTLASMYDQILVQPIYQAQDYKFLIENLASSFSYEYTRNVAIPDFRLKWAPGVTYGLTYDVSVSYKKNNLWSPYGAPCPVTMGPFPTTQLRGASCGASLTDQYTPLYYDSISGANDYEIKIVQNTLAYDHTWTRGGSQLDYRLYWAYQSTPSLVDRVPFGFTYDVQVRALVGRTGPAQGNLVGTWGTFGPTCTVTLLGQPQTQLVAAPGPQQSCGKILTNLNDPIYCIPVIGASNYRYHVVNTALGYDVTTMRNSSVNDFRLTWLPTIGGIGLRFGTTYDITVSDYVGGVWSVEGPICQVTTPASPLTSLQPAYCPYTLPTFSTPVYSTTVIGATNYRYRITDVASSGTVYTKIVDRNSPGNDFRFSWTLVCCGGLNMLPNTAYNVEVASYAGGVWSAYGSVCVVTTGASVPRYRQELAEEGLFDASSATALSLNVYPNPAAVSQEFAVELNGIEKANETVLLDIYNVLGERVYRSQIITKEESRMVIKPEQVLAPGVYTVEARLEGKATRLKFIVK